MANLEPLRREDLPELEELFQHYDDTLSFVPNSLFTMARRPEILRAFSDLITKIWRTGTLPIELKPLIAVISSQAAGCRYCQAHEAVDARERGVDAEKIASVWEFETNTLFSEAERSALRLARDASLQPNLATREHFDDLRGHYTEGEVVEIMAVISLFGFLNRWNDTMATDLEEEPFTFASGTYRPERWKPGKHRHTGDD